MGIAVYKSVIGQDIPQNLMTLLIVFITTIGGVNVIPEVTNLISTNKQSNYNNMNNSYGGYSNYGGYNSGYGYGGYGTNNNYTTSYVNPTVPVVTSDVNDPSNTGNI